MANITAIKILADEQTATFGKKLGDPTIPKRTTPPITHFRRPEHITEARVEAALYSASCKSSVGPDRASTAMLRTLWEHGYKHVLLSLLRQCYLHLPDFLKEAWLSPIPKPNRGFRPIAFTSHFGKIVERIMADELAAYLADLPEMQHQYGCRSGRHIAALLSHLQHVAVRSHREIVAIFLDIVGAYHRVGHDPLLDTMEQFAVPPHIIEFTADFLNNRSFKVRIYRMVQFILSDTIARPHTGLPPPPHFRSAG